MSLEEKLLRMLEGADISDREQAEVLNELYEMGIQDLVLGMFGWFKNKTIVDFVKLSRMFSERDRKVDIVEPSTTVLKGRCS